MTGLQLVRLPLDLRAFTRWALSRGYLDPPPVIAAVGHATLRSAMLRMPP